ncbi:nucleolin [Discoglossus pictus]
MVKLAKGAKMQAKPKKAAPPPPEDVDDSEEEEDMEDSSEEEVEVPVKKTPAKKAVTPAKATPGKKSATPAKAAVTPGKKGATPAGAKNGKQAKKQESEDEEDSDEESEEEKPVAKKPVAKKPVAKKEESEDDDDDDDEDESEEEKPVAKKPAATKPAAKKPAAKKEESEDEDEEDSEDEVMEVTPAVTKGKKPAPAKAEPSEEDDDDDDDEEEDEDDEEDEEEETVKESGKRTKEMSKKKNVPEAKKQKTEGAAEGLSVFVGNLNFSKDFDELKDALREFFSKKSLPVQDVRIGASKKFGYVEFASEDEVEQALALNGKKVLGYEMKMEKAMAFDKNKSAESKKERDARTLFIKNIPYSITSDELQEIFENAKDIRLPVGKDGSSKGIAYVEFNTEADADKAMEEKQGTEVEGRSIFIDYTGEKSQNSGGKRGGAPAAESKTLVVNNLSYNATEDSLQEVFEKATSIRIPQNNQGRPKGFAFVEFSSVEEAKEALDSCNNTEVEGRSIRLEFSQGGGPQGGGRGGSAQSKTLFVRGLSEDTTEETLKEAFDGSMGARIVTDRDTGASKGFGFVDFSSAEDAKAAKDAMEDGEIDGNKVTLDFAKPKGDNPRGGGGGRGGFGRGGFGGRGGGRGGFGGRGGGRGGFGGGRGGGRGRGGFGGGRGGGFRGGNQGQGKKIKFDD